LRFHEYIFIWGIWTCPYNIGFVTFRRRHMHGNYWRKHYNSKLVWSQDVVLAIYSQEKQDHAHTTWAFSDQMITLIRWLASLRGIKALKHIARLDHYNLHWTCSAGPWTPQMPETDKPPELEHEAIVPCRPYPLALSPSLHERRQREINVCYLFVLEH
jgi:hypothetical protein